MPDRIIISASRRMDLPAFQMEAFLRWCQRGWIPVPNPFSGKVSRVNLRGDRLLGVVFWTRCPGVIRKHLSTLEAHFGKGRMQVLVSLTGYPRELEAQSPPLMESIQELLALSERLGPEAVRWRFDPLVISALTPPEYLLERFHWLADKLHNTQRYVCISWLDRYKKLEAHLPRDEFGRKLVGNPTAKTRRWLAEELLLVARKYKLQLQACCEEELLDVPGIQRAHCIDASFFEAANGLLPGSLRTSPTRPGCGCAAARDIGIYKQCAHGCIYCYAGGGRACPVDTDPWSVYT